MTSKEKIKQYKENYTKKKPLMNTYVSKKYYWKKKGYTEEYIRTMYENHGDGVFKILKTIEDEKKIREEIVSLHSKLSSIILTY